MTDNSTSFDDSNGPADIVAKTLSGLETVLANEMSALGAGMVKPARRAVTCRGSREVLYRLSLWSRCATRLLVPIHQARVFDPDQLYEQVGRIDWSRRLTPGQTFAVDATVAGSRLTHSQFVVQRTKDAIVDQLRRGFGRRPSVDRHHPDLRINVHLVGNHLTLSMDASGEPLSRRGYRTEAGRAPLNESLAAGIIRLSGWEGRTSFVDGMCGSGTLAIEAAMMAMNLAPGLNRRFCFMNWPDYDEQMWRQLTDEARSKVQTDELPVIIGGDRDGAVLEQARSNARRAGVAGSIRFVHSAFEDLEPPAEPGLVIMNPPYDERLEATDIEGAYRTIGDTLKQRYSGWTAWILTGNLKAAKRIGLRPSQRIQLQIPPLECRLLKFELYHGSRKGQKRPQ